MDRKQLTYELAEMLDAAADYEGDISLFLSSWVDRIYSKMSNVPRRFDTPIIQYDVITADTIRFE